MRRRGLLLAAAVLAVLLAVHVARENSPPRRPTAPALSAERQPGAPGPTVPSSAAPNDPARVRVAEPLPDGGRLLPEGRDLVASLNDPREAPEHDLEVIENLLSLYRQIFGGNPPGGFNREIVAALLGGNPRRLAILPPDLAALGPEGDLLDRWGTPFYFHPVSRQVMEVLSAGPDKLLWTPDDVGAITPAGPPVE